jgi:hypothetical protein
MTNVPALWGDLRAQARFAEGVAVLGEPTTDAETRLSVLLARLLSDDEHRALLAMIQRRITESKEEGS